MRFWRLWRRRFRRGGQLSDEDAVSDRSTTPTHSYYSEFERNAKTETAVVNRALAPSSVHDGLFQSMRLAILRTYDTSIMHQARVWALNGSLRSPHRNAVVPNESPSSALNGLRKTIRTPIPVLFELTRRPHSACTSRHVRIPAVREVMNDRIEVNTGLRGRVSMIWIRKTRF